MKAHVNALFLNALCHPKKVQGEYYYTLSFLDEEDNSYNCYISQELYDDIGKKKIARFNTVDIELSIYRKNDGNYSFSPVNIDVCKKTTDL